MTKKPTLSLCMIVKDEADFLKSCVDSVKSIIDEIIIVDTGSKDDTIKIAESFGVKVIEHKWVNNFSEARNVSLKHATKDWILVLDADEKISSSNLKEIKKLIENDEVSAYSLIQRNYFQNRKPTSIEVSSKEDTYSESKSYDGWFPSRLVRLFKNNKEYYFTGMIHELVEQSIEIKKDVIVATQIPIHHFRIEKDPKFDEERRQKYLNIGIKQIESTPNDPKPYYEVGQIYLFEKNYEKAIELFEKAVEIVKIAKYPKKYKGVYVYLCLSLGKCYIKTGKYKEAINFLKQFLNVLPNAPVVHFFMAQAYSELGKINEAVKHYRISAKFNPNDEEIHNNLANIYSESGRPELAIKEFKTALKIAPDNATIHRNLGATYFKIKKYINSHEHFKRAVELNHEFEKDLGDVLKQLEKLKEKTYDTDYSFSIG